MYKIFSGLHHLLRQLFATHAAPDPLSRMDSIELADLPVFHPRRDDCAAG